MSPLGIKIHRESSSGINGCPPKNSTTTTSYLRSYINEFCLSVAFRFFTDSLTVYNKLFNFIHRKKTVHS